MLTDEIKQEIRNGLAKVMTSMPSFRPRPGQRFMIAAVSRAFGMVPAGKTDPVSRPTNTGSTFACINGGTGIGKSLAYILPGAIIARHKEMKLVVASSTVALQEQLVKKDLPLFLSAAGISMKVELAKGRTRYVCKYKLRQALGGMQQISMFDDASESSLDESDRQNAVAEFQKMLDDFQSKKWDGDRDSLEGIEDETWGRITTDRHGCLARLCPCFKSCAQMDARQRLKTADIIVANHDLVLSDIASGGGMILPKPEECLYVFDEAHHLPGKAVNSFASNHLLASSHKMLERLDELAPALHQHLSGEQARVSTEILSDAAIAREGISDALAFFGGLQQLVPTQDNPHPMLEFEMSMIPDEFLSIGGNVLSATRRLLDNLASAYEAITEKLSSDKGHTTAIEKIVGDLGVFYGRIEAIHNTWLLFLEEPDTASPPIAKWVTTTISRNSVDYMVCASPVLAAAHLKKKLWDRAAGVTLCSATMTTLGNFDDFLTRSGLRHYRDISCIDVPSPFDYEKQGVLEIPAMKATPKDVTGHTAEVLATVTHELIHLQGNGMLVLFTSRRQMEDVARQLPPELRAMVQIQGEAPKTKILADHRARVDRNESAAIFGLESFSEGVDLVGRYCVLLLVTRLPFQAPDNPVLRSLCEWIDRRGGNSFMEVSVPDAARKLEQRVGRLIRTESDSGRIMVLDTRLWTTRFGRSMLRGLPPFKVFALGKEVRP